MKINKKILAAAAIVLPLSIGTGSALAYFTANVAAGGGAMVAVGPDTEIDEPVSDMTKHVTIRNGEDGGAVYVRVMAFADGLHTLTYTGTGWELGTDGYYYYNGVVEPGAVTSQLDIKIETNSNAPELEDFNVIVIYERTPVEYDSVTGEAKAADWTKAVKTEETLNPAAPEAGGQQTETSGSETGTETPEEGGNEG